MSVLDGRPILDGLAPGSVVSFWRDEHSFNPDDFVCSGVIVGATRVLTVKHAFYDSRQSGPPREQALWLRAQGDLGRALGPFSVGDPTVVKHKTRDAALLWVKELPDGCVAARLDFDDGDRDPPEGQRVFKINGFYNGQYEKSHDTTLTGLDPDGQWRFDTKQPKGHSGSGLSRRNRLWGIATSHYTNADVHRGCGHSLAQLREWLEEQGIQDCPGPVDPRAGYDLKWQIAEIRADLSANDRLGAVRRRVLDVAYNFPQDGRLKHAADISRAARPLERFGGRPPGGDDLAAFQACVSNVETFLDEVEVEIGKSAPEDSDSKEVFRSSSLKKTLGSLELKVPPLTIELKQIVGVVSENAQGKTVLLRLIAGDLDPDRGIDSPSYPRLGGAPSQVGWPALKRQIGYVPQRVPPWQGRLQDTLHFEAAMHGLTPTDNKDTVAFIIERLELGAHLGKAWSELSGGFQLRFAIARALVGRPSLLVLDEPLANLDMVAKAAVMRDLQQLADGIASPFAVVVSSHDLQSIEAVCTTALFVENGHVRVFNAKEEARHRHVFELDCGHSVAHLREMVSDSFIRFHESHLQTILSTPPGFSANDVLSVLLRRGVQVSGLRDITLSVRRAFHGC